MTEWCISDEELMSELSIMKVIEGTSVDGVGLRTSVYLAGCSHHCKGCQNPHTWDISNGTPMRVIDLLEQIKWNDFNVTFSGGDPFYQIEKLVPLAKAIKHDLGKTIWCYTGYTLEQIQASERLSKLLPWIDVLVDGRYVEELRDTDLLFRGSSNQRIIEL